MLPNTDNSNSQNENENENNDNTNNNRNVDTSQYQVGQLVQVEPRLWAGINRPGGVGRISAIGYCGHGFVETVDVKYVVGGRCDTKVDLDFIQPYVEDLGTRKRSSRNFYADEMVANSKTVVPSRTRSPVKKKQERKTKKCRGISPSKKPTTVTPVPALAAATATVTNVMDSTPIATSAQHHHHQQQNEVASRANVTKASTKQHMTLQTGSEIPMTEKRKATKLPIKFVCFPSFSTLQVSPLQNPPGLSPADDAREASTEQSYNIKKRKPLAKNSRIAATPRAPLGTTTPPAAAVAKASSPPPQQQLSKEAPRKYVTAAPAAFKKKLSRSPRPLPLSKARVPLRQIFDNDMDQRKSFVEELIGAAQQQTTTITKTAPLVEAAAAVMDTSRQESFNKYLGQLFPQTVDSIPFSTLMKHMMEKSFTKTEIHSCMIPLEDRFMVADDEVYKI